ncbi:GNAT family N-acetyltransferase [Alicyclobacillus kakegawensis]|uniref:GNAT family N-acetyltransferase n=1 Tax=Alicyclobacillus kakegawensis TaxID=392012 RepID=UPI0008327959|nr:GNAT family N-acetyltransferase [Alicyclobacillus kakegawensis]
MATIRMAVPQDIEALTKIRFDLVQEYDASISANDYPAFSESCKSFLLEAIADGSKWKIWVAEVGDRVAACMFLQLVEKVPRPGGDSAPFGYLTNVYTVPEYRGQGIGRRLLREITVWAAAQKLDFIIVWPSENSVAFYSRNGFSAVQASGYHVDSPGIKAAKLELVTVVHLYSRTIIEAAAGVLPLRLLRGF